MNEQNIIKLLAKHPNHTQRYTFMVPNCYTTHDNEADLFCVRKSGLCDEFEIKTSRSDFLADKRKRVCNHELEFKDFDWKVRGLEFAPNTKYKFQAMLDGDMPTNYFWYVVKKGICEASEIPSFAGFIEVSEKGTLRIVKSPDKIHGKKLSSEKQLSFAKKNSYRFWDLFLGQPPNAAEIDEVDAWDKG